MRRGRRGGRWLGAMLAAVTAMAVCAGVAPAAEDLIRDGPDDTSRAKGKRIPAASGTAPLEDFWPESPRIEAANAGEVIPDHYIVVFKPGSPGSKDLAREVVRDGGGKLKHTYGHALQGFSAVLSPDELERVRRHPNVEYVEQDRVVGPLDVQSPATWGLDRIDQYYLPLNNAYTDGTEGAGVHAYVIDSGIRTTHTEFAGRIGNGIDVNSPGGSVSDCLGHGTHVAGTVGGARWGVADKVILHPVRVFACSGGTDWATVIAAVDWVKANAIKPAVVNMSLGGGAMSSLDSAVANAIASGITFVLAAGNDGGDACQLSPARVVAAITVGATTNTDNRPSWSSYGTCLDLFAPGANITSAWYTGDTATSELQGTSMASPHAAGAAALYLSNHPTATPQQVRDALVSTTTPGRIIGAGSGSPNRLLRSPGSGSGPPVPENTVVNGGFEDGLTGWTARSSRGHSLLSVGGRTGTFSASEGGHNFATDTLGQAVRITPGARLFYHWLQNSQEPIGQAHDYLRVQLYNASTGAFITSLRTWTNRDARNAWRRDEIDLGAYVGQTVRLQFTTTTDSFLVTRFFIDDVSIG